MDDLITRYTTIVSMHALIEFKLPPIVLVFLLCYGSEAVSFTKKMYEGNKCLELYILETFQGK